jgi:ferredoxin-NADP reductase
VTVGLSENVEYELDLTVAEKNTVARDVVALVLEDESGNELPVWTPGAHIDLVFRDGTVRQYSLTGALSDRKRWTVAVLRVADGRGGSLHIHEILARGSIVRTRGPRNHFALVDSPRYIFIAGGIGVTPIRPMIAAAEVAGAEWTLRYGGRTRESMAFADELYLTYPGKVTLWPEDEHGLLDLPAVIGTSRPGTKVYCCGPERLLRAVEDICRSWPPGSLHIERFSAKTIDGAAASPFIVRLERSEMIVDVSADTSIMEAVRQAGVDVPSSCEEGICGTCETRVLGGTPDHRDSVLSPEEQATNRTMMICVSRGLTDLVLDL